MELLPLVCVSLLTWSGTTFAAENENTDQYVSVEEGGEAILPCSFSTNIKKMVFDWKKDNQEVFLYNDGKYYNNGLTGQDEQFIGRVFHFENELKNGNASIKIQNTKLEDNGTYSCIFPDKQKSYITLYVASDLDRSVLKDRTGENIPGAAPEPSVKIINQTKDWALLQCAVRGAFPKPEVHWEDSGGNIVPAETPLESERGGRYYITLQTTVTKTDHYRCVATQKEIHHQIYDETYVHMNAEVQTGFPYGWVVGAFFSGIVLCVFLGAGCYMLQRYKKNRGADYKSSSQEEA